MALRESWCRGGVFPPGLELLPVLVVAAQPAMPNRIEVQNKRRQSRGADPHPVVFTQRVDFRVSL